MIAMLQLPIINAQLSMNVQYSMFNLQSLKIVNCKLKIAVTAGAVL